VDINFSRFVHGVAQALSRPQGLWSEIDEEGLLRKAMELVDAEKPTDVESIKTQESAVLQCEKKVIYKPEALFQDQELKCNCTCTPGFDFLSNLQTKTKSEKAKKRNLSLNRI